MEKDESQRLHPVSDALYAVVFPTLVRYCRSLTGGDSAMGEDLAQDAFLRALTDETFFTLEERAQRAWLYQTAKRLLIDRVRRQKREESKLALLYGGDEAENPFAEVEVVSLLGLLPPEWRNVFQLRYLEGYNAKEIGELLDQNPSTVRSTLLRARKFLAAKLLCMQNEEGE